MTDSGNHKITPTSPDDAMLCLIELKLALDRNDLPTARGLLSSLVSHTAWLSDFDHIFECLDGKAPDVSECLRWTQWQLGNLKLGQAVGADENRGNLRETKPYPSPVAVGLIKSSTRTTAERTAVKVDPVTRLDEETETSIVRESENENELDDLWDELLNED